MILGYSRRIYAELIERCDLSRFLDCHIHAFEYFGGLPDQTLYDRMKNVYIGKIAGRKKFNDTLVGFALHYGFKPEVAPRMPLGQGKDRTALQFYPRRVLARVRIHLLGNCQPGASGMARQEGAAGARHDP